MFVALFLSPFSILHAQVSYAQSLLTEAQYTAAALAASPAADAARLETERFTRMQGTAYAIPDPLVNLEAPNGDHYVGGVMQSFRLPGYYQKQHQYLQRQTELSQAQAGLTRAAVAADARRYYLESQYLAALDSLLAVQSDYYGQIAIATERLYKAGRYDALQPAFAQGQAAETSNARRTTRAALDAALARLQAFAALPARPSLSPLAALDTMATSLLLTAAAAPGVRVAGQAVRVSQSAVKAEQARFKPNFSVGYLNQGPRENPIHWNYRAAIEIPVWTRQYRSSIQAARIGVRVAQRQEDAARLSFRLDSAQIAAAATRLLASVKAYQRDLVPRADRIIAMATRLRQAGQTDVISHLRVLNDAFGTRLRYLDLLYQYRQSLIAAQTLTAP